MLNFYSVLFLSYAPWCPACQNLQPEWENFAEWGEDLEVNVAKVDVTEQPGTVGLWLVFADWVHKFILFATSLGLNYLSLGFENITVLLKLTHPPL